MNDAELNKSIADLLGEDYIMIFDYRDWRILMPLVLEYLSRQEVGYCMHNSLCPQLALAECLLKVLEAKEPKTGAGDQEEITTEGGTGGGKLSPTDYTEAKQ